MNLRKIIFVLCTKLILTSCLNLYPDLQKSEISNEPADSDKSDILQDSIYTQNSALLGWWVQSYQIILAKKSFLFTIVMGGRVIPSC